MAAGSLIRNFISGGSVQAAAELNQARMDANTIASMTAQTNNAISSMWANVATSKISDDAQTAKSIRY